MTEIKVEVLDSDGLRQERLAHDLRENLTAVGGVHTELVEAGPLPDRPESGDRKGGADQAALLISLLLSPGAVAIALELIRAWCQRDQNRRVRVVHGDRSLEIPARMDAAQERLGQQFLAELPQRDGEPETPEE